MNMKITLKSMANLLRTATHSVNVRLMLIDGGKSQVIVKVEIDLV